MNKVAEVQQEKRLPTIVAGAKVQPIVPGDFDSAYRIAQAVCAAGMAPRELNTPEKSFVAIMHGLEVGLPPMQALQSIAVINGRPSIWGDGAIGLVRGSGLCEYVNERIDGEGDAMVAICEVKRRNEPRPVIGKFSVAQARRAGLWTKSGPWKDYPERMLQMRARAFALRDGFADVLRGLHIAEEVVDIPAEPRDVTPPPAPAAPSAPTEIIHVPQSKQGQGRHEPSVQDEEAGIPDHLRSEHDIAAREVEAATELFDAPAQEEQPSKPKRQAKPKPTEPATFNSAAWAETVMKALRAADSEEEIARIEREMIDPHEGDASPLDFNEVSDVLREIKEGP